MNHPEFSIEHLALLSRLELEPDEAASLRTQLDSILGHIDTLQALDLGPEEDEEVTDGPLRDDTPHPGLETAAVLANAPAHAREQIVVPRIIDAE